MALSVLLAASFLGVLLLVVVALGVTLAITLLALRLLESRRGWGAALLAAIIGWGTAALVALCLNRWDRTVDGLVVHVIAIGIAATPAAAAAAAVIIDVLARPAPARWRGGSGRPRRHPAAGACRAPAHLRAAALPRARAAVPPGELRSLPHLHRA